MPDELIDPILPHLFPTVRTMVELERQTGMRSEEVYILRDCDINRNGINGV